MDMHEHALPPRLALLLTLPLIACGDTSEAPPDAGAPRADAGDTVTPPGACPDYTARRRALFGDLHVHTRFSFDSYGLRNPRNGPEEAYRFARGEAVSLPPFDENGQSTRPPIQLARPLDFTAVTDHSEWLGEVQLCTTPGSSAYTTASCVNFRNSSDFEDFIELDSAFAGWGAGLILPEPQRPSFCARPGVDCLAAGRDAWARLRAHTDAAHAADPCNFTALQGYEYSSTQGTSGNHRNVIFRTSDVPESVISTFEAPGWEALARALVAQCSDAPDKDCEALAIPHNPNLSNGVLFAPIDDSGAALTAETAALRARIERMVEVVQTKGASECRNGFSTYSGAEDEACRFEHTDLDAPLCQVGDQPCRAGQDPATDGCVACAEECAPGEIGGTCVSPLSYVRNVLKEGMMEWQRLGVNPYKFGFGGSTDTHNATPGNVDEEAFEGHHGFQDDEPADHLDPTLLNPFALGSNPGGLTVVWAEQNTRDAIFDAMLRREAYATSGTRPIVRFYGGVSASICDASDFVATGDAEGVPMGGDLAGVLDGGAAVFAVHAMQDPMSVGLQQIEIVKTWVDASGRPREAVYDITPDTDRSATVDTRSCAPSGPSQSDICAAWTDPDFDPAVPAAYYARVFEVPTCRWTQWKCLQEQVDCSDAEGPFFEGCCTDAVPKTIRERAWTSPIFYEP